MPAVACLNLILLLRLSVWFAVLLTVRYGLRHLAAIGSLVEEAGMWLVGCALVRSFIGIINLLLLMWGVQLIFGRKGDGLIPKPTYVGSLLGSCWRVLVELIRTVWSLVNGTKGGQP